MPTLRELVSLIARETDLDPRRLDTLEDAIRREFSRCRIYVPPIDSNRDPRRIEKIKKATVYLPTRVVAERFGLSDDWVRKIKKRD